MPGFPSASSRPSSREISDVLRTVGRVRTPQIIIVPPSRDVELTIAKDKADTAELVIALRDATIAEQRAEITALRTQLDVANSNSGIFANDLQKSEIRNEQLNRACEIARATLGVIYHTTTNDDVRSFADLGIEYIAGVLPSSLKSAGSGIV